jgi:hypothetical protein
MRLLLALAVTLCLAAVAAAQPFELTVSAPAELSGLAARIERTRPDALAAALERAGLGVPPEVHVTLVAEGAALARGTPGWIVGQARGTDAVVIFPGRIGSYPHDSLESVVLHEIVHLALNARAGGRPLPRWFHEGVAVSVEAGWGLGSQVRLLAAAARSPAMDDIATLFASGNPPDVTTAYLLSAALVDDVRRRHGLAVPGAIAGRVARGEAFDPAFEAETGEPVEAAAAHAWRLYRGLRWLPIVTSPSALWAGILLLACLAFVARLRRRRQKRWEDDVDIAGE